eukprot:TRINITY_DN33678_c0_g1_i1.p1 TRINITY_DN33678_c0_g1~~TRINITY_DN33678_c0_g1_i1.p1  ORF type:complete len:352 (-),score=34.71 TRINITY_DN33678_c0_g1_i1:159-1214(-)
MIRFSHAAAFAVAVVAILFYALSREDPLGDLTLALITVGGVPWHTGEAWQDMLELYDRRVANAFAHCRHEDVPTRFGTTQVHVCGPDGAPEVFLFHGARFTATMWADVARLFRNHTDTDVAQTVAVRKLHIVDYICDAGRSVPVKKCPNTASDHADWVEDLFTGLSHPVQKADFVGYSFGAFLSALVANERPRLVRSNIVLSAPAGVFAPISAGFWLHVIAHDFSLAKRLGFDLLWFWQWMTAPEFDVSKEVCQDEWKFHVAIQAVRYSHAITMIPYAFSLAELKTLAGLPGVRTTLVYPAHEVATDAVQAPRRAREAGIDVVLAENAGHLLCLERPEWFASTVARLLRAD